MRMQRERIRIEEKELDFVFEVLNVQFNQLGQYQLVLTVENPLMEDSGSEVRLRVRDGETLQMSSCGTDLIQQASLEEVYACTQNKFVFTLPKGFCKNDKNHDVRLRVEAMRVADSGEVKAGEGFFAVYPRTDAPRINMYAGPGDDLYRYGGTMALLRVHDDSLAMHCGRLLYSAALREARARGSGPGGSPCGPSTQRDEGLSGEGGEGEQPSPGSSALRESQPGLRPWPRLPDDNVSPEHAPESTTETRAESLHSTPGSESMQCPEQLSSHPECPFDIRPPSPPERSSKQTPDTFSYTHVTESPRRRTSSPTALDSHTSLSGQEVITITLHGASGLPPLSNGGVPLPFVAVRTEEEEGQGQPCQRVTHCPLVPTHCPSWEQRLSVEIPEQRAPGQVVVLDVADGRTKELLAHFRLPVESLHPFHHHHLELLQVSPGCPLGGRLYVTMVRNLRHLPRLPGFSFTAFEVCLQAMNRPLKETGGLVAVARIVADYASYRDAMLLGSPTAGVRVSPVCQPLPPGSALPVPTLPGQGQPQISGVWLPEEQPVWNHSFLFLGRDCATIFTAGCALVLEYYLTSTVLESGSWSLQGALAFSILPLEEPLYRRLVEEGSQRGLKVERLPLEGSSLATGTDAAPSVCIALRLIGSKHPSPVLTQADMALLPRWDEERQEEEVEDLPMEELSSSLAPPHPEQEQTAHPAPLSPPLPDHHALRQQPLQRDGYDLPPYDALAQILPQYLHMCPKEPGRTEGGTSTQTLSSSQPNQTGPITFAEKRPLGPALEDPSEVREHQTKELENYRTAMGRMAEDIIALRSQVATLESENCQLRLDRGLHQDMGHALLDDTDIDVMTKTEIADRLASLKLKLANESSKAADQRDKIQQLQNELIRKNDSEKELLRLREAHQQQQVVLQRHRGRLGKMAALEGTVRQQEKVIEKMEKVLNSKLRERNQDRTEKRQSVTTHKGEEDRGRREMEAALIAENSRLRVELDRLRHQPPPLITHPPAQVQQVFPDQERLQLLSQLEVAKARAHTLESQLEDNAKCWGREKQEMLTRLEEQDYGFARTSTMILHDLPLKSVSDSVLGRMRYRHLDPMK